ncbi:arylsulfatase I isoform X1 [Leptidea sinapis]|uniref:arylsulfatase I isoform X1 n=1 Tax=Leptidea sinapis TaxID=189913 RepID=UPI00212C8B66|nr:arylsulfatase I isoform X1 [Leptidea sinapis]
MVFGWLCVLLCLCQTNAKPNIILIIADDLGWNDIGFHGSNELRTPNIDALASSGLSLHNYYVAPICTPSRASLMTGKYGIHTGMQHGVIYGMEPRGLPLSETILPQYLKKEGYSTHLVGKWHLGSYKKKYLPLNRGFDSHLGFWTGKIDMYDHTTEEKGVWGFDFRRGFAVAHDLFGKYATDVYTEEAVKIIKSHNTLNPLFLMVAHSAVHTGNPYEPIRAPEPRVAEFEHIQDPQRRKFAAVVSKMDESVGAIVQSLQARGMLQDTIILFSTDNGGPAAGFNSNAASNYPLRGVKNTLWEGGVRGVGILWSPLLAKIPRVATQRIHIVDWLPTLLTAAGVNVSSLLQLDGLDQWATLSNDLKSQRSTVLHNIDDIFGSASLTVDQWKIHVGTNYNGAWDGWYGPEERKGTYNVESVVNSTAAKAIQQLKLMPNPQTIIELRDASKVMCGNVEPISCKPLISPCLFNIEQDPCERRNLASLESEVLNRLLEELDKLNRTAVPPNNKEIDSRGDPKYWGRTFTNFGDYTHPTTTCSTDCSL